MPTKNNPTKYTEEFKRTIESHYQSGKTYAQIQKEYGVSSSALSNWVRKYSQVSELVGEKGCIQAAFCDYSRWASSK